MKETELFNALCRENLYFYMMRAFEILHPSQELEVNWHLECIAEHLTASYNGELPRLIINMPPRCLKSETVAQIYPSWVLGKEPQEQFIGASYAHSLAERNVSSCRRIMKDEFYLKLFPETRIEISRQDYFTTTKSGQYKGTGIGGTVTGFGCGTLLIDDPQNPNEANSPTVRTTTNQEIRQTLFSRFNDKRTGKLIMIMQRLHDDDATGNLAKDGGYFVLKLPAETKTHIHIEIGGKQWEMKEGELLTPRLPREALDELRIDLQELGYAGQYLQSPIPIGGGEFRKEWYQYYDPKTKKRYGNIYILCDAAGGEEMNKKKKKTSDWTAFAVIELGHDNNYYLLDMVRDRLNPTERVEMLFTLHRKWNSISGKAPKVGYEKYGMMTDTHYIKVRQNEDDYRFPIIELGGGMMKEERIRRIIPDLQRGRWWFPHELIYIDGEGRRFDLIKELLEGEFAVFPRARFDDMSDAISRIKDPELGAIFPQIEVKPLYNQTQQPDNWMDW